jgi:hypothetical protein
LIIVKSGEDYGFIVEPIGYNGPIVLAVAIDGKTSKTAGIQIVSHVETKHYVRDMERDWFISRFKDKSTGEYLEPVRLEARDENDVVCITGATVTTEAIVNGVNAAMGAYRKVVLKQDAPAVEYAVKFTPGEGNGPVETGSLAIRVKGVVVGEVPLTKIKEMPSVKRTMSIHSTSGVTNHSFRGTLLSNVLDAADPKLREEYDRVYAVGVDDYLSDIRMDEVLKENSVYVMYEDNGEPLPKKDGKPGGMRIVVLDDVFGQRFTNYLLEISLE